MKVGFIGLGRMGQRHGRPRARRRPRPGGLRRRARARRRSSGPRARASRRRSPTSARTVTSSITMLVEDAAVLDVALRPGGLCDSLPTGAIHMVMGTHGVATIRALEDGARRGRARRWSPRPCSAGPTSPPPDSSASCRRAARTRCARASRCSRSIGRRIFHAGPEARVAPRRSSWPTTPCSAAPWWRWPKGFSLVRKYDVEPQVFQDVMVEGLFAAHGLQGLRPEDGRRELRPGRLADHRRPQGRAA